MAKFDVMQLKIIDFDGSTDRDYNISHFTQL